MKKKITEAQKRAIANFQKAVAGLEKAGVAIVRDNESDYLHFYNKEDVKEFVSYDERDSYPEAVDITDDQGKDWMPAIITHAYYPCCYKERVLAIIKEDDHEEER